MTDYVISVRTFEMGTEKAAALKPLEEAAEVYAAWQAYDMNGEYGDSVMDRWLVNDLADEIADTIQAACNLAARYDIDLDAAMRRCEVRNRQRGRYE